MVAPELLVATVHMKLVLLPPTAAKLSVPRGGVAAVAGVTVIPALTLMFRVAV